MPIQAYMDAILSNSYFSEEERKSYRGSVSEKKALYEKGHVIHFFVDGGEFFISAFQLNYEEVKEHYFVVTDCASHDSDKENQRVQQSCHLIFPPVPEHLPNFLSHLSSQKKYDEQSVITCLEYGYSVEDALKKLAPPITIYDRDTGWIRIQREVDVNWFVSRDPEDLPQPPKWDSRIVHHPFERNFLSTLHIKNWVELLQEKIQNESKSVFSEGGSYRDIKLILSHEKLSVLREAVKGYERMAKQPNLIAIAETMSPQDLYFIREVKCHDSYEARHNLLDSSESEMLREERKIKRMY